MWREGSTLFSEPKSYMSKDNGETWVEFIPMNDELSTSNSLSVRNGRMITSGRIGQAQLDWIGNVTYTDF